MIIKEALSWAVGSEELSLVDAMLLLAYVLQIPKEEIFTGDSRRLTDLEEAHFKSLVARRTAGEPIAYLRNKKEFFGMSLFVDARVLIPRPETELLVEWILELVKNDSELAHSTFVDVGTGSGAIALALAGNILKASLIAVDISPEALIVAAQNAAMHHLSERVTFLQGNLLVPLIERNITPDVVVANLPYIPEDDVAAVEPEVHAYEPHSALYSGKTGLEHYKELFAQVKHLKTRYILGEIGMGQEAEVEKLAREMFPSMESFSFRHDLAGIPRVFLISLNAR